MTAVTALAVRPRRRRAGGRKELRHNHVDSPSSQVPQAAPPTAWATPPAARFVTFGEFGIRALTPAYVTNRQIESARIAMTCHIKRGGKVWINIYPDRPLTKKPAETRMGSGKGSPEWWVANDQAGSRPLRGLGRLQEPRSRGHDPCHPQAAPQGTHHQARGGRRIMAVGTARLSPVELDTFEDERLVDELKKAKEELFNLRFQSATGQLESHGRLKAVKRDIARIYTVIRERELGIRATPAPVEAPAKAEEEDEEGPRPRLQADSDRRGRDEGGLIMAETRRLLGRGRRDGRAVRGYRKVRRGYVVATRWTRPSSSRSRTA